MKQTFPIMPALYVVKTPTEVFNANGESLKVGAKHSALGQYAVPKRGSTATPATISYAGLAVKRCKITGYSGTDFYGVYENNGDEFRFKVNDADEVFTDAPDTYYGMAHLGALALVAKYEPTDPDTKDYREKVQAGTATVVDCYRFCDAFYYGYAVPRKNDPNITVYSECSSVDVEIPTVTISISKTVGTNDSVLPWLDKSTSAIPHDCSIESARAGKYRLNWTPKINDNGEEYDFSADVPDLSVLDDAVQNDTFTSVAKTIVTVLEAICRANKIDMTDKTLTIDELLKNCSCTSILRNILLCGDPGAGKSINLKFVAAAFGIPYMDLRLSAISEADTMTEEIKVSQKGFTSMKSKMYWYAKFGGIICLEDVSNSDTNTLFATIGGLLETPFHYQVGEQIVERHPLCFIAATANIGTEGSRLLNEALITRFPTPLYVTPLSADAFKKCIAERAQHNCGLTIPQKSMDLIVSYVFDVYNSTNASVKTYDADLANRLISLRACISLTENYINTLAAGFELDVKAEAIKAFANCFYVAGAPDIREVVAKSIDTKSIGALATLHV